MQTLATNPVPSEMPSDRKTSRFIVLSEFVKVTVEGGVFMVQYLATRRNDPCGSFPASIMTLSSLHMMLFFFTKQSKAAIHCESQGNKASVEDGFNMLR